MTGFLLDSNIAIKIISRHDKAMAMLEIFALQDHNVFFSLMTESEVFAGLHSDELEAGENLFEVNVLPFNKEIARQAATIRRFLKEKTEGKVKLPDAIIIATALKYNLVLVTEDRKMINAAKQIGVDAETLDDIVPEDYDDFLDILKAAE